MSSPLPPHLLAGQRAEQAAAAYLEAAGFQLLARNVRLGHDEIDVIAFDPVDEVVVFVEVKSRTRRESAFDPIGNAHGLKRHRIHRAARRWVAFHGYDEGFRLDLISVVDGRVVQHLRECAWR